MSSKFGSALMQIPAPAPEALVNIPPGSLASHFCDAVSHSQNSVPSLGTRAAAKPQLFDLGDRHAFQVHGSY